MTVSENSILRKINSSTKIIRKIKNWPVAIADHAGILHNTYICQLRDGPGIEIRPGTDDSRVFFEIFIRECYSAGVINENATVVDIGANIGCFSLLAARKASRVIACEPHPQNLAVLDKNIIRNNVQNVETVAHAISGNNGAASLVIPDDDGFVGRYSLHPGRGTRTVEVDCITLSGLIREKRIDEIDLMKIDCQGSEYEILYESKDVLGRVRQIIVECEYFENRPLWSQDALEQFLQNEGFHVVADGGILYAVRK